MPSSNERKTDRRIIAAISIAWALFQLALPRLIILDSTTVRAVHLSFAITLVFLTYRGRAKRKWKTDGPKAVSRIPLIDYILAGLACLSVLYFVFDWTGITMRAGLPIRRDVVISVILIVLLLEATRRAIGPALVCLLRPLYAVDICLSGRVTAKVSQPDCSIHGRDLWYPTLCFRQYGFSICAVGLNA
ncbi:MAG: hypothetical protein ACYS6W_11975 [Planctomycetota bacterium]